MKLAASQKMAHLLPAQLAPFFELSQIFPNEILFSRTLPSRLRWLLPPKFPLKVAENGLGSFNSCLEKL
jgi:hypothetical protein